ncbi:MAG: hypothetical protein MZU97_09365 [Bacillus subtilis]|nr:hypothetical protein [Bacillus subtilis]
MLIFDEKIIKHEISDPKAANIELLPSIYSSRHEIMVKPLKKTSSNFLVWTLNSLYNFNIFIDQKEAIILPASPIQNFTKEYKQVSSEILAELDGLELDKPPHLLINTAILSLISRRG